MLCDYRLKPYRRSSGCEWIVRRSRRERVSVAFRSRRMKYLRTHLATTKTNCVPNACLCWCEQSGYFALGTFRFQFSCKLTAHIGLHLYPITCAYLDICSKPQSNIYVCFVIYVNTIWVKITEVSLLLIYIHYKNCNLKESMTPVINIFITLSTNKFVYTNSAILISFKRPYILYHSRNLHC